MELCDTTLEDFWPAAASPGSASSAGRLHRVSAEHEMKRLKRALFSRDADATALTVEEEHGSRQPGGQQNGC
jgi:hypothetical protein